MANTEGCVDPIYTTPLTPQPLPNPDDCSCEGGGGGGHKYTFSATATGWQVREDGKLIYSYTDKNTNTTYTWQATEEGWLVKDNTGKVIFTYTDKKNKDTTYSFEKKDDCGFKVTDSDGKVVFDYDNDCAGTTYTYEQTGVDFKVTDNKTGKVVFTYKGTVDTNTTYTYENYKDGFKVLDDKGTVVYRYDPNLGKDSDGSYAIDTLITTVFKGHTTISVGQIQSFDPADLVVGETLVYDGVGSVGVITKDNGDGTYQVTTMTTSPGSRQGVRLGSVNTVADLPATCAAAEAMGWQTPQLGDFAYVTTGGAGDVVSEYVITTDTDCNLTWTFSHSFNAGDYQAQSTTSMSGMILTGGAVQGTFGAPIDPSTLIRGVKRNGILLTPDADGKVNVIVDDSHIIVNALPTTGIVDKAEYVVIDANQKVTGTWVHDATGWYQTYAAVTQVKAHQVVTALPTTGIEENVEYVVVDNANKVTGTWVYDPTKGWLQTEVMDKPAHIVVKDLPTTDINDEVEYVQVGDLDDPVNTFVATWVHTDNGWVKTGESVKAQKAHIAVTALPTTNINENAEYLVMTDTSDPDTLTGTWVRVNGNWVQTEKVENGYHLVTALPTTDIDDKSHYVVVGDLAQPDITFLGEFVYDKTANKWIDLKGSTEITYNIGRDGQMLASWTGSYAEQAPQPLSQPVNAKVVEYSHGGPADVISFNPTTSVWTFRGGDKGRRFEILANLATLGQTVHADAATNGVQIYADWNIAGTTTPVTPAFGQFNNPKETAGYGGGSGSAFQFDVPAGTEIKIQPALTAYTSDRDKKVWVRSGASNITIKEIGRVVDPVAYLLNDGDAQEMPVGSLIQTMSNSAPKHYLICDGSEYAIGTYPELEAHFLKEFGAVNHFGGANGKWKVPDLRGEFLRMAGVNSHINTITNLKEGNGADVGAHQEASVLPQSWSGSGANVAPINYTENMKKSADTLKPFSKVGTNGWSTTNTYGGTAGAQTVRPTNTSVNVAIKCESTPRVIVDQGTYKVSVPFTITANNSAVTFDVSNAEDDTTMVKNSTTLVAPVTGYYAIGTQINGAGDWLQQMALYITRSNLGVWQSGVGVTGVFKLQAGDEVEFDVAKVDSKPKSGYLNMALVNTVADHKVAEMMQKPNLWTPGVEQSFGDGVYGQRFVGTISAAAKATNAATLLPAGHPPIKLMSCGGEWEYSKGRTMNVGMRWTSAQYASGLDNMTGVGDALNFGSVCPLARSNAKYDVWILYTK